MRSLNLAVSSIGTHLEKRYVIVVRNGHVILRMWNHCLDLDLLRCIGKRIATRDTQLYGPILQIDDCVTVRRRKKKESLAKRIPAS